MAQNEADPSEDQSDPRSHIGVGIGWEQSLTEKLRVLLHSAPLLDMKKNEARREPGLRHYDALALAVKVLDLIIENMGLDHEANRGTVTHALFPLLAAMDAEVGIPVDRARHEEMVGRVLSSMRNEVDRRRPFRIVYQDFTASGEAVERRLDFRLVVDEFHPAGGTVLRLSPQAVNLFLRAMDLDIESEQAAAEAIVKSQLERGRFDDAVSSARNARLQSLRYQEKIVRILLDTRRDLQRVDWKADAPRLLDDALTHIAARLDTEETILGVARQRLSVLQEGDENGRAVAQIRRLVEECRVRHVDLHRKVMEARNVFLDEQERQAFRPSPMVFVPSLHDDVLAPLLRASVTQARSVLTRSLSALGGAQPPKLLALNDLVRWQLHPRRRVGAGEVEVVEADLTDYSHELLRFSDEVRSAARWILDGIQGPTKLSFLLDEKSGDATPVQVQECVALSVLKCYAPEEDGRGGMRVTKIPGEEFRTAGFRGDELELAPSQRHQEPSPSGDLPTSA